MSAISDVARLAGVSKSTASRALTGRGYVSEKTRRRVSDAAAESFADVAPGTWLLAHIPWTSARHRILAAGASADEAAALGVGAGTACLILERSTWRGDAPGLFSGVGRVLCPALSTSDANTIPA